MAHGRWPKRISLQKQHSILVFKYMCSKDSLQMAGQRSSAIGHPLAPLQIHMPRLHLLPKENSRMAVKILRRVCCVKYPLTVFTAQLLDLRMTLQVICQAVCNDLSLAYQFYTGRQVSRDLLF